MKAKLVPFVCVGTILFVSYIFDVYEANKIKIETRNWNGHAEDQPKIAPARAKAALHYIGESKCSLENQPKGKEE